MAQWATVARVGGGWERGSLIASFTAAALPTAFLATDSLPNAALATSARATASLAPTAPATGPP